MKKTVLLLIGSMWAFMGYSQPSTPYQGDRWQEVLEKKRGTITALWNGIEPFIYRATDGRLMGVEYEVMHAFANYTEQKYGVKLTVNWVEISDFHKMIDDVKYASQSGIFGWGYLSITDERGKYLRYTPPYMPDLNVLVTHANQELYKTPEAFVKHMKQMHGFAMANTTMAEDLAKLRSYAPQVNTGYKNNDYEIAEEISRDERAFGYLPLSIYIVALQRGLKVKRQPVWAVKRPGFAGIYPQKSDWEAPINEYFKSEQFQSDFQEIARRYLGTQMWKLVFLNVMNDSLQNQNDLELLQIEKDLFAERVIEAALDAEYQKNIRNILFITGIFSLLFVGFFYARYRGKKQHSEVLSQQNNLISEQKAEIERMNMRLEMKVLQFQSNPHFIFNSLNALQYFISLDDRKGALAYLASFSKFIHELLENAGTTTQTVQQESEMIGQYLRLEKIRFLDKFDFEILADENVKSHQIPTLLIYPLVENALYHSLLNRKDNGGFLRIKFHLDSSYIVVVIEDNGVGKDYDNQLGKRRNSSSSSHEEHMWQRIRLFNQSQTMPITISPPILIELDRIQAEVRFPILNVEA